MESTISCTTPSHGALQAEPIDAAAPTSTRHPLPPLTPPPLPPRDGGGESRPAPARRRGRWARDGGRPTGGIILCHLVLSAMAA